MMRRILILATALALAAPPAQADPVTWALLANGVSLSAATMAVYGAALARIALGVGLSLLTSALAPKQQAAEVDVSFDVELGDTTPLSFILGDYATAGKRKYVDNWGKDNRFIAEVVELSCLPQDLAGLWVDDEAGVWDDETGHAWLLIRRRTKTTNTETGAVTYGDWTDVAASTVGELAAGPADTPPDTDTLQFMYVGRWLTNTADDGYSTGEFYAPGNRICVRHYDGTQTGADPFMVHVFGEDPDYPWTADHIGTGKSYAVVITRFDDDSRSSYPAYLWELAPLPLYDPRLDTTAGGAGAQRWGDRATYAPSRNPAVIAYNIARGIYLGTEWIFGGRNLAPWRLPFAEWVAAMNACDATVTLEDGSTEPAYRAGAEITVDMEPLGVLEELGRAANMRFAEVGGRLKPLVDLPGAAVLAITDADILISEGQSLRPFVAVSETFNALSATYPEPSEKWATKDAPEYIDEDATAEDGQWSPDPETGEMVWVPMYLPTTASYPAAPHAAQVSRLMAAQLRDFRRWRTHQLHLPPLAYPLEPLDMISWTSARNGYAARGFLIESVEKTPGMCVALTLREVAL